MSREHRMVLGVVVLISAVAFLSAPANAEEPQADPPAAAVDPACQPAPDTAPEPVFRAKCDFCDPNPFNPRFGVVCTFTGNCQPGANGCCEYACGCGTDTGNTTTPANACPLDLPDNCCPGGHFLCYRSYCDDNGVRCVANGCGVGCCSYECGPDPTCTAADPLPPGVC